MLIMRKVEGQRVGDLRGAQQVAPGGEAAAHRLRPNPRRQREPQQPAGTLAAEGGLDP